MKVNMRVKVSGTRNGEEWPAAGGWIDVPDEEAHALIGAGVAVEQEPEPEQEPETATAPEGDVEQATTRRRQPRRKAGA